MDRSRYKLARDAGELSYTVDSSDLAGLRALMSWKSVQCRRNGWFDTFDRSWIVDVVDYLFNIQTDVFRSLLSILYAGGTPVAAQFGLRFGSLFAGWFTAYDARYGKYSPGLLQFMSMAAELATAGVRIIDLGTAPGGYKERLRSYQVFVARGMAATGPVAAGAHRARRDLAAFTYRHLRQHPVLLHTADQVLRHYGRIG